MIVVRLPAPLRPLFPYLKPAYHKSTAMLSPAMIAANRRADGYLPTGVASSLDAAARTSRGRSVVVREPEALTTPPRLGLPAGMPLSDRYVITGFPRLTVAELPGGRVLGTHRAVVTARGDLVDEVSRYFDTTSPRQHPMFLKPTVPRPVEIEGRVGVLAARGDWMYFHFLMDVLPRLELLSQAQGIARPDHWYVPQSSRFQRELMELLGIDRRRIIDAALHPHIRAECLVVASVPSMLDQKPPWVIRYLRSQLLDAVGATSDRAPSRRLYVSRGPSANNRRVRNEAALLEFLRPRGFEVIDPGTMSVAAQIRTFADAAVVIAPHGAGLTNLVFASPGSRVIELFPSGTALPDYWRIAAAVPGLDYRYLSAASSRRPQSRQRTIVRDIDVDIPSLTLMLDEHS